MEEKLQTILNHLGNTAVYVVRQDNNEILYYNDRVRQITPQAALGRACHDVWAGSCAFCPLTDIGERDTHSTIGYNDPFGDVVDLCATRMTWGEDEIPAFLISVTPRLPSREEKTVALERDKLAAVTSLVYPVAVSLNLTKNEYTMIGSERRRWMQVPERGVYDSLIQMASLRVDDDARVDFACTFSRAYLLREFGRGRDRVYFELRMRDDGGVRHWVGIHVLRLKNPVDGDVLAIALCKNEDERRDREQQLSRERAAVYDSLPGGVVKCILDEQLSLVEGSRPFFDMFGAPESFTGGCKRIFYSEDRPSVLTAFYKAASCGESISEEFRVCKRTGEIRWMRCEGKQVGEQGGCPVYLFVLLDITVRKMGEMALEQERLKYRIAVEHAADVLFEYTPADDTFLSHENPHMGGRVLTIRHYLRNLPALVHPEDCEAVRRIMTGALRRAEIRIRQPGGDDFTWFLFQGDALRQDGAVQRVIGTLRNISDVRDRELALKKQERLVNTTLDTVIGSAFDEVLYLNLNQEEPVLVRRSGVYRPPEKTSLQGFVEQLIATAHPDSREEFCTVFSRESLLRFFAEGRDRLYREGRRMGSDGAFHWVSVEAVRLEGNDDGNPMVLLLLNTIDERKKLEEESQLVTASILAAYGELIALDPRSGAYRVLKSDVFTKSVLESEPLPNFADYCRRYGFALIHPEDQKRFFNCFSMEALRRASEAGEREFVAEVRRRSSTGEYRWCEMMGVAIGGADGWDLLLTFRDIHELRQARQEKRAAEQRFVAAVNMFYDAIYEYDLFSGELVVWKDERRGRSPAARGTHIPCRGLLDFSEGIAPGRRARFMELFDRGVLLDAFSCGKKETALEVPHRDPDGVCRWYAIQVQLLGAEPGRARAMVYLKDVDETRRAEERKQEALRDALALAEQSNTAKSDFLSRMSHDMRTPMNAVIGMTAIAAANLHNPDKLADCLGKIEVSAKFLLSLINDVLDMSRIESGKMKITTGPFDLRALIGELESVCGEQARQKAQRLTVSIGEEVERRYIGDALRIRQVLMNLLGNAVKYTPDGGRIALNVVAADRTKEICYLRFGVCDNGIGMSEPFQARLFEPFEQERLADGRVFEGTGLGLSITRNLVHLMNGQISVTSRLGEGSEFVVTLPLARMQADGEQQEEALPAPAAPQTPFAGEHVLLVEDNALNREIAQTLLEMELLAVETAENGQEAVERFQASAPGHYRAVLMDIRMPVMDGLEATRLIRALDRADAARVPIIAMTANAFQEERQEAQRAGITAYLTKPVEAPRLYAVLHEAFGKVLPS